MCGIAGIVKHEQHVTPNDFQAVLHMLAAQQHRGPDGESVVVLGKIASELTTMLPAATQVSVPHLHSSVILGHRRLAIIDLSEAGRQPLANEAGTVWLTYNGEIYNYRELREDLRQAGHRFTSHTDSEVIVHGYEEWGIEYLLSRLRGMFAFALYDTRVDQRQGASQAVRLILARDRLGIKPLYYAAQVTGLIFASEVRALLATGLISDTVDPHALIRFLQLGSVPVPLTTAEAIRALPAGHYMIADHEGITLRSYWQVSEVLTHMSSNCQSEAQAIPTTRALLDEAIDLHLLSDVPLGAFLSGGIDSSALVALGARQRSKHLTTLSVGFSEAEYDESHYARQIAKQCQTRHHEIHLNLTHCISALPKIINAMDQPTADGVNTYFVAQAAKDLGLTVALSGIGGDEVFLGYNHLRRASQLGYALAMLRRVPRWARHSVLAVGAQIGGSLGKVGAEKLHYLTTPSDEHLYLLFRGLFTPRQIQDLLGIGEHEIGALPPLFHCQNSEAPQMGDTALALFEFHVYLQSQLLKDADCMGMAHSLEIRVPFLDHRLVEYVLALPLSMKHRRHMNKPLLVHALGETLPRFIWDRPKQGFTFPFAQWLRKHANSFEAMTTESGLFERRAVAQVWRNFLARRQHWSRPWALFVLSRFTLSEKRQRIAPVGGNNRALCE